MVNKNRTSQIFHHINRVMTVKLDTVIKFNNISRHNLSFEKFLCNSNFLLNNNNRCSPSKIPYILTKQYLSKIDWIAKFLIVRKECSIYRLHYIDEECTHRGIARSFELPCTRWRSAVRTHSRTYAWVHVALKSSGLPWNVVRGVFEGSSKPLSNPSTPSWLPRVPHARSAARDAAAVTLRGMKRTASDAPLKVFLSRDTGHLVTSPFASGRIPRKVVAHVCFMGNHQVSDRVVVGCPRTSTVHSQIINPAVLAFSYNLTHI